MKVFDVLFVAFFRYRCSVSFFPVIWKYSIFQTIFEYCEKRFNYSVTRHFQHANTDYVMIFVGIEFTDYFFYIILRGFNISQVLIGNGISSLHCGFGHIY